MTCHFCWNEVHECLWHPPFGSFWHKSGSQSWPGSNQRGNAAASLHCRGGAAPEDTRDEIQSLTPAAPDI